MYTHFSFDFDIENTKLKLFSHIDERQNLANVK